ncbi:hypothetical protein P8R33_07775 [Qipengyuania sp. XHP0211]|uniref:hypothetical protein n=1 Tax=Qipengyuania sp. XHP0211 TaxID=3038079 RepID=UPI00241F65EE|nr:hypothetical protein [Qipengyuania sp. XHP0211]MDG5750999.1 hypothetical protein [Qipengyuania sp. XHP0211]
MNPRKIIGALIFVGLLIFGGITKSGQDDWNVVQRLAFILAVCLAMVATFYDRKNLPKKVWDFDLKRGFLYFCFGWILFPIMVAADAFTGGDFSWSGMLVGTLGMSILIGIAGTFTENVGIWPVFPPPSSHSAYPPSSPRT